MQGNDVLDRRLVANGAEAIDAALLMVAGRSQLRHGYTLTVRSELEMSGPLARTISNDNDSRGANQMRPDQAISSQPYQPS